MGAGVAFVYVGAGELRATGLPQPGRTATTVGAPAPPATPRVTTTPPAPSPVLPFNAKLVSQDIPVPGGGVRGGACSGALIAPQWVATAGHCFHDLGNKRIGGPPPYTMTVTVGKLKDTDPGGHVAQVVDVRQSPVNDLAVVKLSAPVTGIEPLTVAGAPPAAGTPLQFAGWGSLSATVPGPSDHLKRGRFTVASIGQITLETASVGQRTVENTPCPEDSGAPFFVSDDDRTGTLVAVVNTGPPCPQPGLEIVARVDVVAGWIHEQTGGTSR
jgi:secreted trypsin-like serine protease